MMNSSDSPSKNVHGSGVEIAEGFLNRMRNLYPRFSPAHCGRDLSQSPMRLLHKVAFCQDLEQADGAVLIKAVVVSDQPNLKLKDGARQPIQFWRVVAFALLAEGTAILAFYGLEWTWLRQLHVLWLHAALESLGCAVQTGIHCLTVAGQRFQIDPECTYVDLVVCSLPLLWRIHRRLVANLALLAGFAAAVIAVNLGRVLLGIYTITHGVSLFWAHDVVDYLLWYPTLGMVIISWARSLKHFDGKEAPRI